MEEREAGSSSSLAGDANALILVSEKEKKWLDSILYGESTENQQEANRLKIEKVPAMLRDVKENSGCYDPTEVSIGPYHHGKSTLKLMQKHKLTMARQYVELEVEEDSKLLELYQKVKHLAPAARQRYTDLSEVAKKDEDTDQSSVAKFDDDEEFSKMIFLDACFILQFIYCIVKDEIKALKMKRNKIALVIRDLFLLENQLPFHVLNELSIKSKFGNETEKKAMLNEFVTQIRSVPPQSNKESITYFLCNLAFGRREMVQYDDEIIGTSDGEPAHLLDLMRTNLFDKTVLTQPPRLDCSDWFSYRSATELKKVGIHFRPSITNKFTDVDFQSWYLEGILKLPQICIDDSTKSMLLNMVAYESSSNGPDDFGVSSYICLMDSLIDHAEDVKELQSKGILLNFLGSDQEVADLFNKMAEKLVAHQYAYAVAKQRIEKHCKHRSTIIGSTEGKALAVRLLSVAVRLVVRLVL